VQTIGQQSRRVEISLPELIISEVGENNLSSDYEHLSLRIYYF
jgi:hypothetical protein